MGTQVTNNLKALGQSWWGPSKPPTMPEGTSTPPTESQTPPVRMGGFGTAPGSQPARYCFCRTTAAWLSLCGRSCTL